jgi:hypothetical protein
MKAKKRKQAARTHAYAARITLFRDAEGWLETEQPKVSSPISDS